MKCSEKTGFPSFGSFWQGEIGACGAKDSSPKTTALSSYLICLAEASQRGVSENHKAAGYSKLK